MPCPFCEARPELENELARAFFDRYPVNPGHMLIVPRRHVATLFDLSVPERRAIDALLFACQAMLLKTLRQKPDGWTVGWNCGEAAGQTVPHAHLHLIPRYHGDTADPRFGIRAVVPERKAYPARERRSKR